MSIPNLFLMNITQKHSLQHNIHLLIFAKDFIGSYNDFKQRIDEIQSVINIKGLDEQKQNIINKLSYINIITSLDTFICDIILTKIIQDEESFNNFSIQFLHARKR